MKTVKEVIVQVVIWTVVPTVDIRFTAVGVTETWTAIWTLAMAWTFTMATDFTFDPCGVTIILACGGVTFIVTCFSWFVTIQHAFGFFFTPNGQTLFNVGNFIGAKFLTKITFAILTSFALTVTWALFHTIQRDFCTFQKFFQKSITMIFCQKL